MLKIFLNIIIHPSKVAMNDIWKKHYIPMVYGYLFIVSTICIIASYNYELYIHENQMLELNKNLKMVAEALSGFIATIIIVNIYICISYLLAKRFVSKEIKWIEYYRQILPVISLSHIFSFFISLSLVILLDNNVVAKSIIELLISVWISSVIGIILKTRYESSILKASLVTIWYIAYISLKVV